MSEDLSFDDSADASRRNRTRNITVAETEVVLEALLFSYRQMGRPRNGNRFSKGTWEYALAKWNEYREKYMAEPPKNLLAIKKFISNCHAQVASCRELLKGTPYEKEDVPSEQCKDYFITVLKKAEHTFAKYSLYTRYFSQLERHISPRNTHGLADDSGDEANDNSATREGRPIEAPAPEIIAPPPPITHPAGPITNQHLAHVNSRALPLPLPTPVPPNQATPGRQRGKRTNNYRTVISHHHHPVPNSNLDVQHITTPIIRPINSSTPNQSTVESNANLVSVDDTLTSSPSAPAMFSGNNNNNNNNNNNSHTNNNSNNNSNNNNSNAPDHAGITSTRSTTIPAAPPNSGYTSAITSSNSNHLGNGSTQEPVRGRIDSTASSRSDILGLMRMTQDKPSTEDENESFQDNSLTKRQKTESKTSSNVLGKVSGMQIASLERRGFLRYLLHNPLAYNLFDKARTKEEMELMYDVYRDEKEAGSEW